MTDEDLLDAFFKSRKRHVLDQDRREIEFQWQCGYDIYRRVKQMWYDRLADPNIQVIARLDGRNDQLIGISFVRSNILPPNCCALVDRVREIAFDWIYLT